MEVLNKILLHVEGFAVFALSLYVYWSNDFSWVWFFILLLVPDLSMIGYLRNNEFGARLYNLFHTYTFPLFTGFVGWMVSNPTVLAISIIWMAHIGMDRMVGYGLKYPTSFKDNHLNRI